MPPFGSHSNTNELTPAPLLRFFPGYIWCLSCFLFPPDVQKATFFLLFTFFNICAVHHNSILVKSTFVSSCLQMFLTSRVEVFCDHLMRRITSLSPNLMLTQILLTCLHPILSPYMSYRKRIKMGK